MEELFRQFVRERRYLKNVTAKTEAWYWDSWRALGLPVLGQSDSALPAKIDWTAQLSALRERGVAAVSVNTYSRAINAFLKWGHDEGRFPQLVRIPRLKEEQKILPTLTAQDIARLLQDRPKLFSGHRLHALCCLLLDSGLRIDEALGLRREHVDLDNLLVRVRGKGRKDRVVPMSLELRKVLFRFLTKHQFDLVFATRGGTKQRQRNVLRDFKLLGNRLGITGVRFSFHTVRHTFAVNYVRAGGNVFYLQRILGHSTLEMTNRYVRSLGIEDLQAVHERLSLLSCR